MKEIVSRLSGSIYVDDSPLCSRLLTPFGPSMPVLGLGGGAIFQNGTYTECEKVFDRAFRRGIRYIDTAHDYGESQARFGKLFKGLPLKGDELFVATKTVKRNRDEFLFEAEKNVELLGRVPDLLQIHALNRGEEEVVLCRGGVLDMALEAKEKGLCKMIGLTSHSDEDSTLSVLRGGLGKIDVLLATASVGDRRFLERVLPYCLEWGIGFVAMKVMGWGELIRPDGPGPKNGAEAFHYVISWPISVAIVGFSFPDEIDELAEVAENSDLMSKGRMQELEDGVMSYIDEVVFYRDNLENWSGKNEMRPSPNYFRRFRKPL